MKIVYRLVLMFGLVIMTSNVHAESGAVMVLDFQLDDHSDLPNAPGELESVRHLTSAFKEIEGSGVKLVPVSENLRAIMDTESPSYLSERIESASAIAEQWYGISSDCGRRILFQRG